MTDDLDPGTSRGGGDLGRPDDEQESSTDSGGIGERVDEFLHGRDDPGVGGGGDFDLGGSGAGRGTGEAGADIGQGGGDERP